MEQIKNKNICIIGFGKEGLSATNYLGKLNLISIIDQKEKNLIDHEFFKKLKISDAKFYFNGKLPEDQNFDYVVRSPGVRPDHPFVQLLLSNGSTLTSTTKIFFDLCPCPIIGVTGTKGKGTTSTIIYEMLKAENKKVYLAGNIGTPTFDILDQLNSQSLVVLELSSFQLMDLTKSPNIAVVLMITSEHLDWHKDNQEYQDAKINIVSHQTNIDFAIINKDYEISKNMSYKTKSKIYFFSTNNKANGAYLLNGYIASGIDGFEKICKTSDVLLPGKHNLQNVLAAISVAKILKVKNDRIVKVVKTFKGLPHRLQLVANLDGVKYYNDSFSTTPETTIAAIESFTNPKFLILGGSSKKSDFSALSQKIHSDSTLKSIILIGVEAKRIKEAIVRAGGAKCKIIEGAKDMTEIVRIAKSHAKKGDIVLLSPACASFDMFKNYQDRGEQFEQVVKNLKIK